MPNAPELPPLPTDLAAAHAMIIAEAEAQAPAPEEHATSGASRRKLARRPLPEHLPRERIVHPGPTACACCGGVHLRALGEDVTETPERIPARWVMIQHVRERFSCRDCETIAQTPAPFYPIPRGRAGPNLLAEVMMAKFGLAPAAASPEPALRP